MKSSAIFVMMVMLCLVSVPVYSHCEIPCGIYDDAARIKLIKEHISTVEKSMKQIIELSKERKINYNQLVRWIDNKESHADKIQHIVTQYFMTQRIKLVEDNNAVKKEKYRKELELLHKMLIYAMKSKQTTDLSYIEKMKKTIDEFEKSYMKK